MRFFFILEYIWVFVILASVGRATVEFSVVTNQTGSMGQYTTKEMYSDKVHQCWVPANIVWYKKYNIY